MHLHKQISGFPHFVIICRQSTKDRLAKTCFRGEKYLPLAGNFMDYKSVEDVFNHEVVYSFLCDLKELLDNRQFGTHSCTVNVMGYVGWSSTDSIKDYDPSVLECFEPNRKSSALRIKPSRTGILAPLTSKVTIVFEFKLEGDQPTAIIHSVYPGQDIGELKGEITAREQCVFFNWNHPGFDFHHPSMPIL